MEGSYILVALAVITLGYAVWVYNALVRRRNCVRSSWSDIDVQLKYRQDLVPALVETARGSMQHERSTLEQVTSARAQAIAAGNNVAQRGVAEAALRTALSNLFAVAEKYPSLRAVENMNLLLEQLTSVENRVAFARQHYNDTVLEYNVAIASFPRRLLAAPLGFVPASLFTADVVDRDTPQVQTE